MMEFLNHSMFNFIKYCQIIQSDIFLHSHMQLPRATSLLDHFLVTVPNFSHSRACRMVFHCLFFEF